MHKPGQVWSKQAFYRQGKQAVRFSILLTAPGETIKSHTHHIVTFVSPKASYSFLLHNIDATNRNAP
ncbi:hypothetical protein DT73_06705 [Mangrovibacter sp. MFB070]|nr:hypothetical protein DT73_06705 [Mangrovibacter sp. MFB070]